MLDKRLEKSSTSYYVGTFCLTFSFRGGTKEPRQKLYILSQMGNVSLNLNDAFMRNSQFEEF